ncbi:MAG TPA: glycosyltransferase family 39 protein [Patescibacteria group bacterium]
MKLRLSPKLLIIPVLFFAFFLRTYGLNWDQSQHLHPDERFMTMVASSISFPSSLSEYFSQNTSALNPYNHNFNFYVYGTVPLLVTRFFAEKFNYTDYDHIFFVGRLLSAVFDCFTLLLVYRLCLDLFKNLKAALFAGLLYSLAVLPIQQSHFFTVDAMTVFFTTFTLWLFVRFLLSKKSLFLILSAFFYGISLASKTSVIIVAPLFGLFLLLSSFPQAEFKYLLKFKPYLNAFLMALVFFLVAALSFRIFQPYAFDGLLKLNPRFISNIRDAHNMITGEYDYPPNKQWTGTLPLIHPFINIFFAGFGPVNTTLFLSGLYLLVRRRQIVKLSLLFPVVFLLAVFSYQGIELAKYMRYFYPVYPVMAIIASYTLLFIPRRKIFIPAVLTFIFIADLIFTAAFLNIYSHAHSRVEASLWIYENIPPRSRISNEIWDDSLPLNIGNNLTFQEFFYTPVSLDLYQPDSGQKWQKLNEQFKSVDYLVMSSARLWGSIPRNPSLYPVATLFYQDLFAGKTNFSLVKKIYSYPGFNLPFLHSCYLLGPSVYPGQSSRLFDADPSCENPGIYFRDDSLEESFTVYDHPQILIFKNTRASL